MKAKDAYKISLENANLLDYVEKQISDDVESAAKCGKFATGSKVLYYDDLPSSLKEAFLDKVESAVKILGYNVEIFDRFSEGVMMRISWKKEE